MARFLICLMLIFMFAYPTGVFGGSVRTVQINFNDVDVRDFTRVVSSALKKNFIVPPSLRGKVTIVSPEPLPVEKLFDLYVAVLDEFGYRAVDYGSYVRIVRRSDAVREGVVVKSGEKVGVGENVVTYILIPKYMSASRFRGVVRGLLTSTGKVSVADEVNALIVTDKEKNVKRVLDVMKRLDIPGGRFVIRDFHVENGNAEDIKNVLISLFNKTFARDIVRSSYVPGREYYHFAVDRRTNTIYAVGTPGIMEEIAGIVAKLDRPIDLRRGNVHILRLNYAFAEDVEKVLLKLFEKSKKKLGLGGEINVVSDKSTNALIVLSSQADFKVLRNIVRELDVKRPQVFVEAQIVEMSMDKLMQIGVEWKFLSRGSHAPFGGSLYGSLPLSEGYPSVTYGGLVLGIAKWRSGTPDVGLLLSAYAKEGGVNIIATPQILTLDNEKAEINISKVIPYSTGVKYDANNNPVISYDYKDVGITLRITPHITASGEIRLKLYEKVEDVTGYANADQTAPVTSKREARTTVEVKNGQTLVIGGLIKTKRLTTIEKVPLLGNIPLVGNLFKKTSYTTEKTNLLVFITPRIVRTVSEESMLTREKARLYNENLEKMRKERKGIASDFRNFGKFDLGEGVKVYEGE